MDEPTPTTEQTRAWLALLRLPKAGPRTLGPLLKRCPDPQQLLHAPPAETPQPLLAALAAADWEQAARDADWLQDEGIRLLPVTSPDYPELLSQLPDAPTALLLRGNTQLLHSPQIAVVGSRNASPGGIENARQFSRFLAAAGISVTSGLARGIDSAAHQGALQADGPTIAVLGTGLDRVYPACNRELAHQIAAHGLLVSEYLPGTAPLPHHFPRRNRIIAGLSLGTLVVEAALQSGSLITARLAAELGREVFAIPGSIHNPMARGCHALIRDGAKLVETAEHIAEELVSQLGETRATVARDSPPAASGPAIDPEYRELLEQMGYDPLSTDQLVARTRFSAAEISSMLLLLELQGHVLSAPGGLFTRLGNPYS